MSVRLIFCCSRERERVCWMLAENHYGNIEYGYFMGVNSSEKNSDAHSSQFQCERYQFNKLILQSTFRVNLIIMSAFVVDWMSRMEVAKDSNVFRRVMLRLFYTLRGLIFPSELNAAHESTPSTNRSWMLPWQEGKRLWENEREREEKHFFTSTFWLALKFISNFLTSHIASAVNRMAKHHTHRALYVK